MPRKIKPLLTFIWDAREQWPYEFAMPTATKFLDGGCYRDGLGEGDYAVELNGERLSIRIERKSLGDFFGCVPHERGCQYEKTGERECKKRCRFETELLRLRDYEQAYLLIDATPEMMKKGAEHSLVSGEAALASALHWMVHLGIPVVFAGNHRAGKQICQRILEEFAWHRWLEMQGAVEGADAGDA